MLIRRSRRNRPLSSIPERSIALPMGTGFDARYRTQGAIFGSFCIRVVFVLTCGTSRTHAPRFCYQGRLVWYAMSRCTSLRKFGVRLPAYGYVPVHLTGRRGGIERRAGLADNVGRCRGRPPASEDLSRRSTPKVGRPRAAPAQQRYFGITERIWIEVHYVVTDVLHRPELAKEGIPGNGDIQPMPSIRRFQQADVLTEGQVACVVDRPPGIGRIFGSTYAVN